MAKDKSENERSGVIRTLFHGRVITSDFFIRNWIPVGLACLMMLAYIHNRYECTTGMEKIRRLEAELEIKKTEQIRERATYMSRIRESSMTELVQKHHLGLQIQERPPYHINRQ